MISHQDKISKSHHLVDQQFDREALTSFDKGRYEGLSVLSNEGITVADIRASLVQRLSFV